MFTTLGAHARRFVAHDYDGVIVLSERAKAARWFFAVHLLSGRIPEINEALILSIARREQAAFRKVLELNEQQTEGLREVERLGGGTRLESAIRTWDLLLGNDPHFGPATEEKVLHDLMPWAENIRQPLLEWLSTPIWGNLRFFADLARRFEVVYGERHAIGLVTQTESVALREQLAWTLPTGESFWGEHADLSARLGLADDGSRFSYAECAGDYGRLLPHVPDRKRKEVAYRVLATKFDQRPSEMLTFEDTDNGVAAAKAAGYYCIGIKAPGSPQHLAAADVVLEGTLDTCIQDAVAEAFTYSTAEEIVSLLR